MVGMNYKDDRQKAMSWLQRLGNLQAEPLRRQRHAGLDLGVYGAPGRSHRRSGIIRWHAGDLNRTGVARGAPAAVGSIQPEGGLMRG